jgi:nucleotide-binding universal stress UspA family protein
MKTILIPVDFSEGSLHSCKYAMKLADNQKVTFHLFHIYNDQVMVPDSGLPEAMDTDVFFNSDIVLALKEQAEQQLAEIERQVKKLIKASGQNISVTSSLQGGDPRWEIAETCKEMGPDLVIMGTRGIGKKGFLEGSMAAKIMAKALVPVLAVPENYSGFRLRNIMFPTHFNKLDIYTLQQLFTLLSHLNFKIHVCHFHLEKKNQEAGILMEELEKAFEKEKQDGKIRFSLEEATDKGEALKAFAEDNKIDLVAFLPERENPIKHLFASHRLYRKDFFKLELPMLALHE